MADQPYEFNVAPIDWATRDTGWKPADGDLWYFDGHPDYEGIIYLIGDGTNVTADLEVYYSGWQYKPEELSFTNMGGSTFPIPVDAYKVDANTIRCTFSWGKRPLQGASSIAFEDITKYTIYGGNASQALDGTYSFNYEAINDSLVMATITKTSGFGTLSGNTALEIRHAGNGGTITLS